VRAPLQITVAAAVLCLALTGTDAASARPKCGGEVAKFVGTGGDDVFRLQKRGRQTVVSGGGDDLILAFAGRDRICAGRGDDSIVAGPQPDLVVAGGGSDVVYGGSGRDRLRGGGGADKVFGDAGSDDLRGGRGSDRVFGGLVDDRLHGGPGPDLIVGGHGGDVLIGGGGEDWLRGGATRDGFFGGPGADTVSFATATPSSMPGGRDGVTVDLRRELASGEGTREFVRGIENVLGSPFADRLTGDAEANRLEGGFGDDELDGADGADSSRGGPGSDACSGFEAPDPTCDDDHPRPGAVVVTLDGRKIDPGLIVIGRAGDAPDQIRLDAFASGVRVTAQTPVVAGPGCSLSGGTVRCPGDPRRLNYVSMAGLKGSDKLAIGGRLARRGEVQFDGGAGSDSLAGTGGDDILFAGASGEDVLLGGQGSDALISAAGRDSLYGGPGNDQLVTSHPCDGHLFDGGPGSGDIAGFARSVRARLRARIGGSAVDRRKPRCRGTRIRADNEVLEGTPNGDLLIGSPRGDPFIIGGPGSDRIEGRGGGDVIDGEEGRDAYFGGPGRDLLKAKDRRRDLRLDCGPGSDYVKRDRFDPDPERCRPPS
jgi:Ca2+-binding RTX toxin-like protein